MKMRTLIYIVGIILVFQCILVKTEKCKITPKGSPHFPKNFTFGVATSAYQIEGAWNEDGKGVSIWDDFIHNYPEQIKDGSNADVAVDSYHRFDDDLKILKDLKVGHYRFSIAWERIFPNGDVRYKNQAGIDYYNDVIDKLIANGIQPLVTMQHMNLPLEVQKRGGFLSPIIIDYFANYATALFELFGDRVKNWMTFNEPFIMCNFGHAAGFIPPFLNDSGVGDYICVDNLLKAHGAAYRIYKSKFFEKQGGKVGIAFDTNFHTISDPSHTDALERSLQYRIGFFAHPIFSKEGGYPEMMVKDIARNSFAEGRFRSRLPKLDGEWKDIIRGSVDFLGVNYYKSTPVETATKPPGKNPSFERDINVGSKFKLDGCNPEGLEGVLTWLRNEYGNIPIIITENGFREEGDAGLDDYGRIDYLTSHLQAVLNAINNGVNVYGYTHWSLMDNFEWTFGYNSKMGLYAVDRTIPTFKRIPKRSAKEYKKIIQSRSLSYTEKTEL